MRPAGRNPVYSITEGATRRVRIDLYDRSQSRSGSRRSIGNPRDPARSGSVAATLGLWTRTWSAPWSWRWPSPRRANTSCVPCFARPPASPWGGTPTPCSASTCPGSPISTRSSASAGRARGSDSSPTCGSRSLGTAGSSRARSSWRPGSPCATESCCGSRSRPVSRASCGSPSWGCSSRSRRAGASRFASFRRTHGRARLAGRSCVTSCAAAGRSPPAPRAGS